MTDDPHDRLEAALERAALAALPPYYVVLRAYPGAPDGWMPPYQDGRWYDLGQIPRKKGDAPTPFVGGEAVAHPTGRFETREDGVRAEVWEVRPSG